MRVLRLLLAACLALPAGGCAGMLNQVLDRPLTSDHLDEPGEMSKLKTLSGDRRLVRVSANRVSKFPGKHGEELYLYRICAETQADALAARSAESTTSVKSSAGVQGEAGLADKSATTLTKTYDRSEISDVYRQAAWQLCNAVENGDMEATDYSTRLWELTKLAMDVLKVKAETAKSAK